MVVLSEYRASVVTCRSALSWYVRNAWAGDMTRVGTDENPATCGAVLFIETTAGSHLGWQQATTGPHSSTASPNPITCLAHMP